MRIGEVIENLIRVLDGYSLTRTEKEAVLEACNILDRLPHMLDTTHYYAATEERTPSMEKLKAWKMKDKSRPI